MAPLTQWTPTFNQYLAQQAQMSHLVFKGGFGAVCMAVSKCSNGTDGHWTQTLSPSQGSLSFMNLQDIQKTNQQF